ncbi:MAG: DUF885 family protein [Pirellula sp.]
MTRQFKIAVIFAWPCTLASLFFSILTCVCAQDESRKTNLPAGDKQPGVDERAALATLSKMDAMAIWIAQYQADQKTLNQRFRVPLDSVGLDFRSKLLDGWNEKIDKLEFSKLDPDNQIDWLLLKSEVQHDRNLLDRRSERNNAAKPLIPYISLLLKYCESKEHGVPLPAEEAAGILDEIASQADANTAKLKQGNKDSSVKEPGNRDALKNAAPPNAAPPNAAPPNAAAPSVNSTEDAPTTAIHAASLLEQLARYMQETHRYHEGYDPKYTWWASKPFESAKQAVANHRKAIREKLAGLDDNDNDKIVGVPIGDEALTKELKHAWIPYTAQELISIGERELQWCDDRFKEAANEMKLGGDWRKALNAVKSLHVEPGDQPKLIRELAWEAVRFLEGHDLITIPEMAKQGWRVEMMSPEAQRVNPYFLGGDNIIVSFPTNTMTHSEKLMSLKSNNIHFCRATVHHELIPGHHLQYYSLARYRPYREIFSSPFWMEGWALYWEMLLWDMGFAPTPEDKVGMLFWRRHRAARIIFSLNYQTRKWSAEDCVRYLIDRVGHEPSAAAAEVRRSIMGGYGPLYQAGYMLGGLQLRSLHKELVQSGKMTNKQFHDAVLSENYIPFELLRAKLLSLPLTRNQVSTWRFYDQP